GARRAASHPRIFHDGLACTRFDASVDRYARCPRCAERVGHRSRPFPSASSRRSRASISRKAAKVTRIWLEVRVSVEIAGRLTTRQRVLLVALLSTAAIVYALPVGRRPIGVADGARQALLGEDTLPHGLRPPARVGDEPDLQKPPLFYWSVALAAEPAGHVSDRNASIPSVVAALATLLGVFFI